MAKRKQQKFVDEPNLKRLRSEINILAKNEQKQHTEAPTKSNVPKLSRKAKRKEARLEKKSRKNAYSRKLPIPTKEDIEKTKTEDMLKVKEARKKKKMAEKKKKIKHKKDRQKKRTEEVQLEQKKVVDKWDDKEIRDLEKKLGMDKRKKKNTLPLSFVADGLDYILEVTDSEKLQAMSQAMPLDGMDSDEDMMENRDIDSDSKDDDADDEDLDMGSEEDFFDDDGNEISTDENDDDDSNSDMERKTAKNTQANSKSQAKKLNKGVNETKETLKGDEIKSTKVKEQADTEEGGLDSKKQKWEQLADRIKEISDRKIKEKKKKVSFDDDLVQEEMTGSDHSEDESDDDDDGTDESDDGEDDNDLMGEDSSDIGDDDDNVGDEEFEGDDNTLDSGSDVKSQSCSDGLKEDIYGRLRDNRGNIIQDNKPAGGEGSLGAYVPPARRKQMEGTMDEKRKLQMDKLQKQLKGLVNRASENNMQGISSQIEQLYLSNSRADVNESLVALISAACISPTVTPDRLSMELMMLVAILHGNVGSEVGAVFLQHLVKTFDNLLKQASYGSGKHMDNVIILLAHLYNFKVVHAVLIFDILKILTDKFQERDIELILVLLRHVGFTLRKDSASDLKQLILSVQAKAGSDQAKALADQSRVRFMLDVVLAIRNNNMRKIPNYDPEHLDHLRKLIRSFMRGGHFGDDQLHIGLHDLLRAEEKGKWWLVGSAWAGDKQDDTEDGSKTGSVLGQLEVSTRLQELARKQRMNTELRRNIFFVIVTSEDFLDAFEKLLRLGLKSSQQQEIVLVIIDCCVQEKKYNPFYAHLSQKLCEHHRTFQMSYQFTIWDRLKVVDSLSDSRRSNLAKLLTHLFASSALSLSVLKVVPFGTLEKATVRLLKQIMTDLLLDNSVEVVESVFMRIAQLDKLKQLHEGLRLFCRHFLIGSKKGEMNAELVERVQVVDKLLSRGKSHVLL